MSETQADPLVEFARAHGMTIGSGVLASLLEATDAGALAKRIVDSAPARLVRFDYRTIDPALLPRPFIVIGRDGSIALIERATKQKIWLSGTGFGTLAAISAQEFAESFRPLHVVSVLNEGDVVPGWRSYILGFARSNAGRLQAAFWGTLIANLAALAMPIGALLVIDKVLGQNGITTLDTIVIALIAIEGFRYLIATTRRGLLDDIADDFEKEVTAMMAARLLSLPGGTRSAPVWTLQRLATYAARYKHFFSNHSVTLLADLVFLVVLILLLFAMNTTLAWIAVFGLATALILTGYLEYHNARIERADQDGNSSSEVFAENFRSLDQYKAMGIENRVWDQWARETIHKSAEAKENSSRKFDIDTSNAMSLNLLRASILWFGAQAVLQGELTLGQFIAFNLVMVLLLNPIRKLAHSVNWYKRLEKAGDGIAKILSQPSEQDPTIMHALPHDRCQSLQFRDVTFRFKGQERPLLDGINLTIEPGQKVAIIGQSGVGKTTLLSLLQGFQTPQTGAVLVGGLPLRDLSYTAFRRQFGVLVQSSTLVPGTILENMTLGVRDFTAEQIHEVAKHCQILDVIEALPDGFKTTIRRDTARLSAGQKQRIYLARALLLGRHYLLLDEPTSTLDRVTESAIATTLTNPADTRTIVAVTHSQHFAMRFDRVLQLRDGKLAELDLRSPTDAPQATLLDPVRPMVEFVRAAPKDREPS